MDRAVRIYIMSILSAAIIAILLYPRLITAIVLISFAIIGVGLKVGTGFCIEPERPVIARFGIIQRIGEPGVYFVIPFIEQIIKTIDVKLQSMEFVPSDVITRDLQPIKINFDVRWRIALDFPQITPLYKHTLMMEAEEREKQIIEILTVVARQIAFEYTKDLLARPDVQEQFNINLRAVTNSNLEQHGLIVETIFWRGGDATHKDIKDARNDIKINHEKIEALVEDLQIIQRHLPAIQPQEILTYHAYLDLLRKGMPVPRVPLIQYGMRVPVNSPLNNPHKPEETKPRSTTEQSTKKVN